MQAFISLLSLNKNTVMLTNKKIFLLRCRLKKIILNITNCKKNQRIPETILWSQITKLLKDKRLNVTSGVVDK